MKTESDSDFFQRVWAVVEQIPYGKVCTFGAIAEHLGLRSGARMVGWALNASQSKNGNDIPAHRVVNRKGELTGSAHFGGNVMKERLIQEGIIFIDDHTVDLSNHFWHPDQS